MLNLTRKEGESLTIGDDVVITVHEIRGGRVRFGVAAPRVLEINRLEVYREKHRESPHPFKPQLKEPHCCHLCGYHRGHSLHQIGGTAHAA